MCKRQQLQAVCLKKKKQNLTAGLQAVKISQCGEGCLQYFTVSEKDACSLLHIRREANQWSVLYPQVQGPVLRTRMTVGLMKIYLLLKQSPYAQNLIKRKLIQSKLDHNSPFYVYLFLIIFGQGGDFFIFFWEAPISGYCHNRTGFELSSKKYKMNPLCLLRYEALLLKH